ncbi:MAG: hypothetical protein CM1200mP2_26240 [Planctomycetaceae bacterium]|nr:MAG: hypothetical protein CM1200mP2_26240 [Planctomycetaceae bacterium]
MNTFRHLTSETDARLHLQSVAASLRPGGLYLLGFPPAAERHRSRVFRGVDGRATAGRA